MTVRDSIMLLIFIYPTLSLTGSGRQVARTEQLRKEIDSLRKESEKLKIENKVVEDLITYRDSLLKTNSDDEIYYRFVPKIAEFPKLILQESQDSIPSR